MKFVLYINSSKAENAEVKFFLPEILRLDMFV